MYAAPETYHMVPFKLDIKTNAMNMMKTPPQTMSMIYSGLFES